MGRIKRALGKRFCPVSVISEVTGGKIILPHLYFTYMFMALSSSIIYAAFGRQVAMLIFGWYYMFGLDSVLLGLAVLEMLIRTAWSNKYGKV
jgi:hypothetical protein|tara:strand:- start:63 stop:338 length:276 start_codon:yes stop_codon:yes gene_type:complete